MTTRKKHIAIAVVVLLCGALSYYGYSSDIRKPFPQQQQNPKAITYNWEYNGKKYTLSETLYRNIYNYYHQAPGKDFSIDDTAVKYYQKIVSSMEAREDKTISVLAGSIIKLGDENKLSDDDIVELAVSFVQSIPYDEEKGSLIQSEINKHPTNSGLIPATQDTLPRSPYETLFDNKGICTDKTYLMIALLKKLGYGTALFEFDNHLAPGIQCSPEYSTYKSGYCLIESTSTTAKIGEVSEIDMTNGRSVSKTQIGQFGNDAAGQEESRELEKAKLFTFSKGSEFDKINEYEPKLSQLDQLDKDITIIGNKIDVLKTQYQTLETRADKLKQEAKTDKSKYSDYLAAYQEYQLSLDAYNVEVDSYDKSVDSYNALLKELYNID